MATRYKYSEETKNKVLIELHRGRTIEDISKEFNVPIPVIEEWERNEKRKAFIEAMFVSHKSQLDYKSIMAKISGLFLVCYGKIKASWLFFALPLIMGGFIFGIVNLYGIANVKGELKNEMDIDSDIDLGFKLDSLISVQNEISGKIDKQIEISSEISRNITINNTYNYPRQRKRPSKKPETQAKRDSCQIIVYCNCCNTTNDTLR